MRKLLIYWAFPASLLLAGCSSTPDPYAPQTSILEKIPLMYKRDVQQGNVLDQELVNRLKPGMTKSQVNYIMGTPLLVDVFHLERWDYFYSLKKGRKQAVQKRISLFFQDDRLVRTEGDMYPRRVDAMAGIIGSIEANTVVSVPDYTARKKGFWSKVGDVIWPVEGDN